MVLVQNEVNLHPHIYLTTHTWEEMCVACNGGMCVACNVGMCVACNVGMCVAYNVHLYSATCSNV